MKKYNKYYISWICLLEVLRNGYNLGCWLAPISEEEKKIMLERGRRYIEKEKIK